MRIQPMMDLGVNCSWRITHIETIPSFSLIISKKDQYYKKNIFQKGCFSGGEYDTIEMINRREEWSC
jgi:hypothetical protein